MDIDGLLARMHEISASDLFLKVPCPPVYKISGHTEPTHQSALGAEDMDRLVERVLIPRDRQILEDRNQVDFSYTVDDVLRFRGNAYRQRGTVAMVFRR